MLRPERQLGLFEPGANHIDVNELHQGFCTACTHLVPGRPLPVHLQATDVSTILLAP